MITKKISARGQLLNDCESSASYHHEREDFFAKWNSLFLFTIMIVSGGGVTGFLLEKFSSENLLSALLAATSLLSLVLLFWKPADKAATHKMLHAEFSALVGKIRSTERPSGSKMSEWTRDFSEIDRKAPPTYYALQAHCYNLLSKQLGRVDDGYHIEMKFYQVWFRNFFRCQGGDFKPRLLRTRRRKKRQKKRKTL